MNNQSSSSLPSDDLNSLMRSARIKSPCSVDWESMSGDDRIKLCGKCDLEVINTLVLSDAEVRHALLRVQNGERVCMRFFRRADGTFITGNRLF
ncbi:MAG: hypothetical protein JST89_06275 [Cyanobacteria bacterium SZAS-4]|nr:hypothetical protein [Cyanobacteria bacterium SZAS-4]